MNEFVSWCRHLLVSFLFHALTSLHPPSFDRNDFSTCILIVGCESDTIVKVGQLTVTLNEMETYIHSDSRGLTGKKVVSNKPISFISGHQCQNVPSGVFHCN